MHLEGNLSDFSPEKVGSLAETDWSDEGVKEILEW